MDLSKLNKEYLIAKKALEDAKKEIEALDKQYKTVRADGLEHVAARDKAELSGDETTKKTEQKEIDRIEKELERIKEALESKNKDAEEFDEIINDKVDQLKQDPNMKQAMDYALSSRYNRKIVSLQKQKETAVLEKAKKESEKIKANDKLNRYNALKDLVEQHPALENNLNGILAAKQEIKKLNDELKKLDYKKDAARIAEITAKDMPKATDKLDKNKKPLMNYINKNKLNIKYSDIEEMASKGIGLDNAIKESQKDVDGLDKQVKGYDKQVKKYDKEIDQYNIAIRNIGYEPKQNGQKTSSRTIPR